MSVCVNMDEVIVGSGGDLVGQYGSKYRRLVRGLGGTCKDWGIRKRVLEGGVKTDVFGVNG